MTYTTNIYENAVLSASAIADFILKSSKDQQQNSKYLNIAVSGGNTPKYLFSILSNEDYRTTIAWDYIRFFWVDERCVGPTHPESNFGMTFKSLLHLDYINKDNIYRMMGENNPESEAARYSELLNKILPVKNGFPVFDLILLGLGDDGHTASIFPDNLSLLVSDKTVAVATHPTSGQQRITLTGKTINNANEVVFLINGKNKASIVSAIINQTPEAKNFPASYVHSASGKCILYLDNEAATF